MAKVTLDKKIAIIGGGHMGSALVKGLTRAGVSRSRIVVSDKARENARATKRADIIFIVVKPSVVRSVLRDIKDASRGKLVVSLAAGVRVSVIEKLLRGTSVARAMPNIPIAHGEGVIGLYARNVSSRERAYLRKLLAKLGLLIEVQQERDLDALTLVAGCGPGIIAAHMSAYGKRASALGIKHGEAVARQVFRGTLAQLADSRLSVDALANAVATKGGVTEAILKELERGGWQRILARAFAKGRAKIKSINT